MRFTFFTLPDSVGVFLDDTSHLWIKFLAPTFLFLFSSAQLHIFRKNLNFEGDISFKQVFGLSDGYLLDLYASFEYLFKNHGLSLCVMSYFVSAFIEPVSILKYGYLFLAMIILIIMQWTSNPNYYLKRSWFIFIIYITASLLLAYSCQFPLLFNYIQSEYIKYDFSLKLNDIGLQTLDQYNLYSIRIYYYLFRYLSLLPPVISYVITIFQLRIYLNSKEIDSVNNNSSINAHPLNVLDFTSFILN